jgi:hypothetical protein
MQASVTEPSAPFERGDQSEACLALAASSPLDTVQHCLVVVGRRNMAGRGFMAMTRGIGANLSAFDRFAP